MSDEMVMPTPDSPAGATDTGLRDAFAGFIQENADSGQEAQGAIGAVDAGLDVDNDSYLNDLLGVETPGNVPYERFREVNERAKQADTLSNEFDAWRGVIDEFKQLGYNSAADIQAALEAQQQASEEAEIAQRYQQLQDANVIDPYNAQLQQEAELTKLRYERQMDKVNAYLLQQEQSQAMSQYPLANQAPELVQGLVRSGMKPLEAAQAVDSQIRALTRKLVPELATKLQGQAAPTPMSNGQAAARPAASQQGQGMSTISQLLGISRNRNSM